MRVTLTFDNGPHRRGTPTVLAELGRRRIPAIFFVVGERVAPLGALVEQAAAEGHVIGNHTWSHSTPLGELDAVGAARSEIARAQQAIARFAHRPPLFRPVGAAPGGVIDRRLLNEEAVDVLRAGRYTTVLWNVLPHDWERPREWRAAALEGCRARDHSVVVLHDAYPDGLDELPGFLDDLLADGAEFTVDPPSDCTPMIDGIAGSGLAELVTPGPMRPNEEN